MVRLIIKVTVSRVLVPRMHMLKVFFMLEDLF